MDRLTKRRSSQKVAKKASSKELKKRRSSLSSEHAKGKIKSSTEVVAKAESNRRVSNVSISKSHSKTHKRSSKDVVVQKTKSQDKTQSDNTQDIHAEVSQETRVETSQETRVEASPETSVEASKETHVKVDHTGNSQETHVDGTQVTRVSDAQGTRVSDVEETREGSNDSLKKSTESDLEVVVQVYVPDEGQTDVPDQVAEQTSQESGDKTEILEKNDDMAEGAQIVSTINLDLLPEEDLGIKKVSSRRALFDNAVEKNLVNIVPRNSMDIIKGIKITPSIHGESKVTPNRSFHSKTNLHRVPKTPSRVSRRTTPPESRPLKVSNFELPEAGQGGVNLKLTLHGKSQVSMHRLASKMSTNLEKVDEGFALETGHQTPDEPKKLTKALNISKANVVTKPASSTSGTEKVVMDKAENIVENSECSEKKTDKVRYMCKKPHNL